jgi:predicted Zn-dependent peptidase
VGSADAVDLETMLQLLHLLVEEPRVDDVGLRSARAAAEDTLRATTTDPRAVLFAELLDAAYDGDPYQTSLSPTRDQIDSLEAGALLDLYASRLGKVDDLVVVLVGDADEDSVERLARTYLGTLSPGAADSWRDTTPDVSDGVERVVRFGEPDSAGGLALFYSVATEADLDLRASAEVLEIALDARLNDTVREQFGATYGAITFLDFYTEPDQVMEMLIVVDGDPARMNLIADVVAAQIGDLAVTGIDEQELQSAAAVVRARLDFIDNGYLTDRVLAWARDPGEEPFDRDDQQAALDSVDPDDVNAVADLLFVDGARVQVLRVPVG